MEKYINYLIKWIKNKVKQANAKGVILGISGGIDSAVIAALAKKAFPKSSLGIVMPIDNMHDIDDALLVCNDLKIDNKVVDLTSSYQTLLHSFNLELNQLSSSNIKPRLRMITLYAYAQNYGYLVLGTSNASEYYLGYFTKYGDGAADLYPIINLNKSQVYEMAKFLRIHEKIIKKSPSAGLWKNQTDELEMGFKYKDLETYLSGQKLDKEIISKIKKSHLNTQHKRKSLIKPKKY